MNQHEVFMKRCFQLAEQGLGHAAPNPMVGSVIVHDGKVIGEGYHQTYGEGHAEVNAVASVANKSLLADSTIYVNLEPCAHHGKTPPCADMIITNRIPRVVVSNIDPFEKVAGAGIKRMRDAGIEVTTGILESEGLELNRRFFTFHTKQRPYIILKWAQTTDGFLDHVRSPESSEKPLKITSKETNQLVHKWRTEESAILVGSNTAHLDDPQLTARLWPGKNPLRILIDPRLSVPASAKLLRDGLPTLVFNTVKSGVENNATYHQLAEVNDLLPEMMKTLHHSGVQSMIVEGGRATLQNFIDAELWDEARVLTGPQRIGSGVAAPNLNAAACTVKVINHDRVEYFRYT